MAETTAAGAKLYIGPANSTANTQNDYEGLSYVEVGKVIDIPEFGIEFQEVTSDQLGDRLTKVFKGQKRAGVPSIVYDHDASDSGQGDMSDAVDSDDDYAFKVTLDDAGSGSPSSPTTFYFRAKVMGDPITIGTANNMVRRRANLGINSAPVEVAAV